MTSALKITDWNGLVLDVCNVVTKLTGNVLEEKQRPMVESRLKRRCLDLKINHPAEYKDYWTKNQEAENKVLIGLLTTHFTSFFREFTHFEWIANELPAIVAAARKEGRKTIKIWSAASSKGQEVWSLCMWLHQHMPKVDPTMDWIVYGSDIDSMSVKEGENGVYHKRELETAPRHLWENLWLRGKGEIADWYKIKPELRSRAKFRTMNLLAFDLEANDKYDLIMCRNVLIYFDSNNLKKIIGSLLKHLTPDGTLITGLSESLNGYGLPIKGLAPSIYKLQTAQVIELPRQATATRILSIPSPLKVLCVDDSSTILTIMKKILVAPQFEIIGVAHNGIEAMEQLKVLKPDVITLDLHMPEMDGLTFLTQSKIASTIPVVIVSSVGREHDPLVAPLHKLGVIDFVEKPSLSNMTQVAEELTQKLKMAWHTKSKNIPLSTIPMTSSSTSKTSFKKRPKGKIIFNFGLGDETKLNRVLKDQAWENDHVVFCYNGKGSIPVTMKDSLMRAASKASKIEFCTPFEYRDDQSGLTPIWLCFLNGDFSNLRLNKAKKGFLVLEEGSATSNNDLANDVSPTTSFSYLVDKFIGGE